LFQIARLSPLFLYTRSEFRHPLALKHCFGLLSIRDAGKHSNDSLCNGGASDEGTLATKEPWLVCWTGLKIEKKAWDEKYSGRKEE
jgi:hypothetical protein